MKNSLSKIINKANAVVLGLLALGLIYGCEFELPGAGSKPDETPPDAAFTYAADAEDFKTIKFTNQSTEALSFLWDFGGGNTSTEMDPIFTFPDEGTYEVTLTATDGLNVSSVYTEEVVVAPGPYQPIILEAGFEDGTLPDGGGDGRDSWRVGFSTVIQISSSPVVSGSQAGKLPASGDRVGYQEIVVEAETNYDISFIYTLTNAVPGTMVVEILDVTANGGTFESYEATRDYVIGSVTLNDQDDPSTYVGGEVSFASGTSTLVAIMISNSAGIDARFDDFAIQIGNSGGVPPSVSFDAVQDADNFLLYHFENTSLNAATYMWDFGDGNTSTDASPSHTYAEAGWKTVKLTGTSEGGVSASFESSFEIHDPVEAGFDYTIDGFTIHLTDTSVNAASVMWDFGDGFGASLEDPSHTYSQAGYYKITLTATSSTGLESEASVTLALGVPTVLGGDFENDDAQGDDRDYWRAPSYSLGEVSGNTPYGGSSDGAFQTYSGIDTDSKTRGAKIDGSKCANADGSPPDDDTRYAYQEISDLVPGDTYYLEFSYNNADGTVVAGQILDGHYDDGSVILVAAEDARNLVELQGTVSNGVPSGGTDSPQWRTINGSFVAPASGNVSIWMWAFGGKSYYDNIKILPAALVE